MAKPSVFLVVVKINECVRSIQADVLVWGSTKHVPGRNGIKKLQIQCVVEEDRIGTDMLERQILLLRTVCSPKDLRIIPRHCILITV